MEASGENSTVRTAYVINSWPDGSTAGTDQRQFEVDVPPLDLAARSLVQIEPMRGRLIVFRIIY